MRTIVTIDDDLYIRSLELADASIDKADQIRAARRLAALGGTMPEMPDVPRRPANGEFKTSAS